MLALAIIASAAPGMASAASLSVTISNTELRRDALDGSPIDCHDGCLERFGDTYYLYGTSYGNTDGFGMTNHYVCYSSPDLVHWTFHGDMLRNAPKGVYYRPYVKYNAKTKKYVLWYNWYPKLWEGQDGVATSDTPAGPFVIQNPNVKVKNPQPGDLGIFVDDDGAGYIVYTSIGLDHGIAVEKLNDDYLSSTLECSPIIAGGCEGPSMIKRNDTYYVFFDTCCCFCLEGSGARVYTAKSPFGPYTFRGNINRRTDGSTIIRAQQTQVTRIATSKGDQFIWMGDKWGSKTDGIKGHDFQYWSSPLQFAEDGSVKTLQAEDKWSVDLVVADTAKQPEAKINLDEDKPGTIRFWGSDIAELYTKEITESYKGVLAKNYVSKPDGDFPPGFVHASPIPQGWSGTFWTRDGGTFLREMTQWGYTNHARLTAAYLMKYMAPNPDGYYSCPEYFRGWNRDTGSEIDGTTSVVIGMVLLWQRLDAGDPLKARIYNFLHQEYSPVRFLLKELSKGQLVAGTGEFGPGCGIPGAYCNVVANNLVDYALQAAAGMEDQAGDRVAGGELRRASWSLRRAMAKYLVAEDGSWIWCIRPDTLSPDQGVLNQPVNKGFGGLNGPACMYSDVSGFDPVASGWWGAKPSMATFDKLLYTPLRKEQFEKWGIWAQFDKEFRAGMSSGPSYGDGYATQTMLLYDKLDLADKCIGWVATSTYSPIPENPINRESRYYIYEQSYTPDAVGKTAIGEGCGALNLVNVTEQLKVARLILGVDDTSLAEVKILPRLPVSWKGVEALNWPIRTSKGMIRADIRFEKTADGCTFKIKCAPGQVIPKLAVRLPSGKGFSWRNSTDVGKIELQSESP